MSLSLFSCRGFGAVCLAVLAGLTLGSAAHAKTTLDRELVEQAKRIMKYCQQKGYKNIGVLKFRIKRPEDKSFTDRAGPLNNSLATEVEIALTLANEDNKPIGIIKNASGIAEKIRGANHLTPDGRKVLFLDGNKPRDDYPLAWGNVKVAPDAFLTGDVTINEDLREVTVELLAFDLRSTKLESVNRFSAEANLATLIGASVSFRYKGATANKRESELVKLAGLDAKRIAAAKRIEVQPVVDNPPVELIIKYDGQVVPYEIRNGQAAVPEPKEGQSVTFELLRKDNSTPDKYGVVLMVNGQNTLDMERLPPKNCRKWVLAQNAPKGVLRGFYFDNKVAQLFRIASPEESSEKEMQYGENCGQISFTVFKENAEPEPDPLPVFTTDAERARDREDSEAARAVSRGILPSGAKDLPMLKAQLRRSADTKPNKGVILPGQEVSAELQKATFEFPGVVMSATITYYRRK